MNVREIAKQAQVSPATVSRYFTGAANLKTETYEKIDQVVQSFGDSRKKKTIGVITTTEKYEYLTVIIDEILQQSVNYDFNVVFIPCVDDSSDGFISTIKKLKLDGLILSGVVDSDIGLSAILDLKIRTVSCGSLINADVTTVSVDDIVSAYEGADYILGLGHRKIVVLSDFTNSLESGFRRLAGCKQAFDKHGIALDEKYIKYGKVTYEMGYKLAKEVIESKIEFTAIFAFSDEMAFGAMAALYDSGIKVPEDVSVLGFDGLPIFSKARPILTTIKQPISEIVRVTLNILNEEEAMVGTNILLPCTILEGETVKNLKE